MSQDSRYKIYYPNFARIEELGARGLTLDHVKDAFKYGNIKSFATHGGYLTTVHNLSYNDKGPDDNPEDSTYRFVLRTEFALPCFEISILKQAVLYGIATGLYQYGRHQPGIGDRLLATWDVHGVLEDFCKAMGMAVPEGDDAYLTAQAQYEWVKTELGIPEVAYGDIMRLMETWIMGVPATEVCATRSSCGVMHVCPDSPAIITQQVSTSQCT